MEPRLTFTDPPISAIELVIVIAVVDVHKHNENIDPVNLRSLSQENGPATGTPFICLPWFVGTSNKMKICRPSKENEALTTSGGLGGIKVLNTLIGEVKVSYRLGRDELTTIE